MTAHIRAQLALVGLTLGICCVAYPLILLGAGKGIQNGAEHEQLLPPGFAGAVFRLVGKLVGLFLCQGSRPILQRTKQMEAGRALHLFKPSDRHHRRQWLAFAFDDELIIPQRHAVE